jgi:hypothetical protein
MSRYAGILEAARQGYSDRLKGLSEKSNTSYDRDLVVGNRKRVNSALQLLDQAVRNLKRLDDKTLWSHVKDLRKAQDLIVAYNKKMSKEGYV